MLTGARNSYAAGMETIARNTPQITQATLASTTSAILGQRGARFTLKALRAAANAYVEGARCNPYWIGAGWAPSVPPRPRKDGR
jgi:hypothetical protein